MLPLSPLYWTSNVESLPLTARNIRTGNPGSTPMENLLAFYAPARLVFSLACFSFVIDTACIAFKSLCFILLNYPPHVSVYWDVQCAEHAESWSQGLFCKDSPRDTHGKFLRIRNHFPVLSFPILFFIQSYCHVSLQHVIQIITIRIIKNKYKYQLSC